MDNFFGVARRPRPSSSSSGLFAGTAGYKTVTGDPTPIQSTAKQLSNQIQNTFR